MILLWLGLPEWAIVACLGCGLGLTGALINWLTFRSPAKVWIAGFQGVVAPFFVSAALPLGLMTGFLASDIWDANRQAARAIQQEADAVSMLIALDVPAASRPAPSQPAPSQPGGVAETARAYMRSVIEDDWPRRATGNGAPITTERFSALTRAVATGHAEQTGVQTAMLAAVGRIADARSTRLSLMGSHTSALRWSVVLLLAVLTQMAVAAVHLERRRAQAVALILSTSASVVTIGLIAALDQPYHGAYQVSPAPYRQVLGGN